MPAYEYKVTYADGSTNNIRALESQVEELTKDGGSYEKTDYIVPLSDHPQRDAYMSYRTALRNWPSTDDFPDTKPTLGS